LERRIVPSFRAGGTFSVGTQPLAAGPSPHTLPRPATVAGSPMLLPRTVPLLDSGATRTVAPLNLPVDENAIKAGLRLADLEAFFAAEAFVPGEG
jgi:hypothetical protein